MAITNGSGAAVSGAVRSAKGEFQLQRPLSEDNPTKARRTGNVFLFLKELENLLHFGIVHGGSKILRIDTHLELWDTTRFDYTWRQGGSSTGLPNTFPLDDATAEAAEDETSFFVVQRWLAISKALFASKWSVVLCMPGLGGQ